MMDAPLLIQRRNRLGPDHLAARGVNRREGHIRIDHPQGRLNHLAAVVDLGNDAISAVCAVERDGSLCPFGRRVASGGVGEHVTVPGGVLAGDDDAGFVGVLARARGRIDCDHDARQFRYCFVGGPARLFDDRAAP